MSSNEESSSATLPPAPSQYPTLFEQYVVRSIQATRDAIPADALFLEVEVRERAMHLLSFGLEVDAAWAKVRDLILCIAPKMEQAGHREDWMDYLAEGLACSQRQKDALATAELQWHVGHLQRLQSQFMAARENLNASAATFAAVGNPRGQARAWNELGQMAWHQQQHSEAQQLAEAALACLNQADEERATSLSLLGSLAVGWKHWQEAEMYFEEALQIRTMIGDQQRIAWTIQLLGYLLQSKSEFTTAVAHYEEAIQILTAIGDMRNCGIAQLNLGVVYFLREDYTHALEIFELAESAFKKVHDSLYLARVLTNYGLAYLKLGQWEQARDTFTSSIVLYEQLQDIYSCINAQDGLGMSYSSLGLYEKAITTFELALGKLVAIQEHPMRSKLMNDLKMHLQEAENNKIL